MPPEPAHPRPRRRGPSIFARQVALYLILILLVAGLSGRLFFSTARAHLEDEVGGKLESVARIAARHTPLERLDLIRVGDDQSRMVLRLKQRLEEIREASGLLDVYAFRRDRTCLLDLDSTVAIGAAYDLPQLAAAGWAALEAGASTHTLGYPAAGGDLRMSAFAPIVDGAGALAAVVGVDAGARELEILERMRERLYWITAGCVAVALAAALFFARRITRPVRHIAAVAERLGAGDYAARARVATGDEVEALADAVNRMAEQVRQRDDALKAMAASVAHEVRNPLNSIGLLLRLLAQDVAAGRREATAETLQTLEYEIGKLVRFTNEFLTYSRPAPRVREAIDPGDLVARVVEMAAGEARQGGVAVRCLVDGSLPATHGDRQRLEQALLNLVVNAVQASGPGGQVVVRAAPGAQGGVDIAVEDTGPGLPAGGAERLFEPFYTTRADGTGLGLANAARIAAEHGGRIDARNRETRGARFTLSLPAG